MIKVKKDKEEDSEGFAKSEASIKDLRSEYYRI